MNNPDISIVYKTFFKIRNKDYEPIRIMKARIVSQKFVALFGKA
jgi:hypothetical protein